MLCLLQITCGVETRSERHFEFGNLGDIARASPQRRGSKVCYCVHMRVRGGVDIRRTHHISPHGQHHPPRAQHPAECQITNTVTPGSNAQGSLGNTIHDRRTKTSGILHRHRYNQRAAHVTHQGPKKKKRCSNSINKLGGIACTSLQQRGGNVKIQKRTANKKYSADQYRIDF